MCNDYYQDLKKSNNLQNIDFIIISMKWNYDEIKYIKQFSDFLIKNSNAKIVFLSKRIEVPDLERSILIKENAKELNTFLNKHKKTHIKLNNSLKMELNKIDKNLIYYDLNQFICEENYCDFVGIKKFNYIDYSHFSLNGSKKVVKKFLEDFFEK